MQTYIHTYCYLIVMMPFLTLTVGVPELSFCSAYGMGQPSVDKEKDNTPKHADHKAEFSPRDVSDMYASAALQAAENRPLGAGKSHY